MSIGSLAHKGRLPMTDPFKGTRLGDYNVIELLGKGGMASVYRGYDPVLERDVAIKVISIVGQSSDFVTRFKREARLVANLRHPNIVQIYHFGEQRDCVYMVQELLSGPTLEQRMRETNRRRLAPIEISAVVEQVARALDFAHSRDVIHRDVKPSNILCNDHGQWVLTDFGVASHNAEPSRATPTIGVVMGTPSYAAPEQAISSAEVTSNCDIYSLGVVLFELLTGRLPFEADTPMKLVLKHLYDEPANPSSLRDDLPVALDKVVMRALSKEPNARYSHAGELAQALRSAWPAGRTATASTASIATAHIRVPSKSVTKAPAPSHTHAAPNVASRASNGGASAVFAHHLAAPLTATTQTKTTASPTVPARARSSIWRRVLVGLFTAMLVGILILYRMSPHVLADAWTAIQQMLAIAIKLP